jgi:hypothetical protein
LFDLREVGHERGYHFLVVDWQFGAALNIWGVEVFGNDFGLLSELSVYLLHYFVREKANDPLEVLVFNKTACEVRLVYFQSFGERDVFELFKDEVARELLKLLVHLVFVLDCEPVQQFLVAQMGQCRVVLGVRRDVVSDRGHRNRRFAC